jgi:hypothetical protein
MVLNDGTFSILLEYSLSQAIAEEGEEKDIKKV